MIQRFNKNGTIEATEFIEGSAPFYLNKNGSIACQEFIEGNNAGIFCLNKDYTINCKEIKEV